MLEDKQQHAASASEGKKQGENMQQKRESPGYMTPEVALQVAT